MREELPTRARVYCYRNPDDGSWAVDGSPPLDPELTLVEESPRDVLAELGLPKDWPALEALATPRGWSPRRLKMVFGDESATRYASGVRLRPRDWTFEDGDQYLTLLHLPLVIGVVERIVPGITEEADLEDAREFGAHVETAPPGVTGAFVIGMARLYDSALADAAWRGVTEGILGYVSAVLVRPPGAPLGAGELVEVGLIHLPACPGARVLRWWEGAAPPPPSAP